MNHSCQNIFLTKQQKQFVTKLICFKRNVKNTFFLLKNFLIMLFILLNICCVFYSYHFLKTLQPQSSVFCPEIWKTDKFCQAVSNCGTLMKKQVSNVMMAT